MKFLFELFPVLIFFGTFKIWGIMAATAAAIGATIVQAGWSWFRHGKVEKMMLINLGIIVVLGSATLILQNEAFIKWKPTVLYWSFALTLGISDLVFGKNLMRAMMGSQLTLPDPVWKKVNLSWATFFALMGVANLYVAFHYPTDTWVNFKLFGGMGLLFLFAIGQAFALSRHLEPGAGDEKDRSD